jgi:hypothetical protein
VTQEIITHVKLRKTAIVALFFVIAAGVTAASIIGKWPWQWVAAGSLLGVIIFFQVSRLIFPIRKIARQIVGEDAMKKDDAPKGK